MVYQTKKQLTSENNKIAVILLKMRPQFLHRSLLFIYLFWKIALL